MHDGINEVQLCVSLQNYYDVQEDGPILGWDGAIMSTFSSEAADWEQSGYGPLLATPSVRV